GYCVSTVSVPAYFATAETFCQNISGRLMIVDNLEKFQFFDSYTAAHNLTHTWIGLDDRAAEGTYMWSDQTQANTSEILTLFLAGEPNDNRGNEDCCEFLRKSASAVGLNDLPCNRSISFICEYVV
ncbi:unnamed protein product, partial [Lymnaea stagnalis]